MVSGFIIQRQLNTIWINEKIRSKYSKLYSVCRKKGAFVGECIIYRKFISKYVRIDTNTTEHATHTHTHRHTRKTYNRPIH